MYSTKHKINAGSGLLSKAPEQIDLLQNLVFSGVYDMQIFTYIYAYMHIYKYYVIYLYTYILRNIATIKHIIFLQHNV